MMHIRLTCASIHAAVGSIWSQSTRLLARTRIKIYNGYHFLCSCSIQYFIEKKAEIPFNSIRGTRDKCRYDAIIRPVWKHIGSKNVIMYLHVLYAPAYLQRFFFHVCACPSISTIHDGAGSKHVFGSYFLITQKDIIYGGRFKCIYINLFQCSRRISVGPAKWNGLRGGVHTTPKLACKSFPKFQ